MCISRAQIKFTSPAEAIAAGKLSSKHEMTRRWLAESAHGEGKGKAEPKWWLGTRSGFGDLYDAVLIGTPWHNAGITLLNVSAEGGGGGGAGMHLSLLLVGFTF